MARRQFYRCGAVLCVVLLLFGAVLSRAGAAELAEVIKRSLPAFVFVGGGSGAVISPDGYIITNAHVARGSKRWKVRTADGAYHNAQVIGSSPGTDLCLLKMDHAENVPFLPLGDSDELEVGEVAVAIGNPFALGNIDGKPTVTLGVISALHVDRPHAYDAIQTDTPLNPGNSGGPLINMKGELVGVNAQIQTRFGLRQNTGIGYAVSSNQVRRFLPALKTAEGKLVPSGRLPGISVKARQDAPPVIEEVDDGSAAAEAGLKAGDVICGLDRAPIEESRDLGRALGRYPIGATVTLHVRRKGDDGKISEHKCKLDIARHGKPYIGLKFKLRSARSMEVEVVEPGSPAAKAGVKKGDHLVGFVAGNRARPLRSRRLYYRLFRRLHPGVRIRLIFRRGKKNRIVTILVGERE